MSTPLDRDEVVYPFNIIFSCAICQATIPDIYPDGVPPSLYGDTALERTCKLWVTECCHVTCSEHLEGGGEV